MVPLSFPFSLPFYLAERGALALLVFPLIRRSYVFLLFYLCSLFLLFLLKRREVGLYFFLLWLVSLVTFPHLRDLYILAGLCSRSTLRPSFFSLVLDGHDLPRPSDLSLPFSISTSLPKGAAYSRFSPHEENRTPKSFFSSLCS